MTIERNSFKSINASRNRCGATMLVVMMAAVTILLPIGLFAFEVARMQMAQKQLRSATDAAALAASAYLANVTGSRSAATPAAKALALDFFKENIVMSDFLAHSTLSSTAATDNPATQEGSLQIDVDDKTGRVRATAAYGLPPAFGSFLGLHTETVRTKSLAGYNGLEGDIVLVVDISDSMTIASDDKVVKRTYSSASNTTTYTVVRSTTAPAHLGRRGAANAIPNPDAVDFSKSDIMDKFKGMPTAVKTAALVEAKRGNLESAGIFSSSNADKGILKAFVTPGPGYKAGYQKLSMQKVLPLYEAKSALTDFMAQLMDDGDAHCGLVTFGGRESTGADCKDDFETYANHHYPHVNLSKSDPKKTLVVESIAPSLTFNGTDTKGGMQSAINMLEGPEHRPEVEKTIILLTDGVPTTGSPKPMAKLAGEKGIRLFAIGFFKTSYARTQGPKTLKAMVAACGNGSKMYYAPDLPTLQDVLAQISHGTLSLLNED